MTMLTTPLSRRFETTIWSTIREAQEGRRTALNDLVQRYRTPLVEFLVLKGLPTEDAEDVAQEVLIVLSSSPVLERADASKGRFRNLITAIAKNLTMKHRRSTRAIKRGGTRCRVSLDSLAEEGQVAVADLVPAREDDVQFDRAWLDHLLRLSMDLLKKSYPPGHEALTLHLQHGLSYEDIAHKTGESVHSVNHHIRQARMKLVGYLRSEIQRYCSSDEEFADELAHFSRFLKIRLPNT